MILKTKLAIVFITSISILSLLGCNSSSETMDVTLNVEESTSTYENEPIATIEQEVSVSDFNELPDDIKGTIIPIDSLLLYHAETGKEYDANDSYMLWRTLQYAFGNFGVNYNRAELKEYSLTVEPMTIGEFTTAILDGDYKNYPIPEELNDQAWYDSNDNSYYFGVGDRGLSQTEILTYQYLDNHNLKVTARLYGLDDNSTICSGTFYFKRNDYASGVIEPLFYYTVTTVEFNEE